MRQKPIDFRELLERLLPLERLPKPERVQIERVLRHGLQDQIEQAAMLALARLERSGAVQRLPGDATAARVRFQAPGSVDVITLELPGTLERDGVRLVPRAALPVGATAGLHQVRRLLRLDDTLLSTDPRDGEGRAGLMEQLDQAGRDVLGASGLRILPAAPDAPGIGVPPLDPALTAEAASRPDVLFYCPDTVRCPRLAAEAGRRGARAVVLAGVRSAGGDALGTLEVVSGEKDPFPPETLALIALLADYCAGVFDRSARLEKLVFVDPLTAVYNRSYFDLQLRNEMPRAQREASSMALCIADIDDFKNFNTQYGYEAGNQVLAHVAQALRNAVRPFDTVARWGGEEFAVLLTAPILADDVMTITERLRSQVARPTLRVEGLDGQSHAVTATVSIGVALFPDHATSAIELWRVANQALLEAKRPPKNRVVFYRAPDPRSGSLPQRS